MGVDFEPRSQLSENCYGHSFPGIAAKVGIDQRGYPVKVNPPQEVRPIDFVFAQPPDLLGFLLIGFYPKTGKNKIQFGRQVQFFQGGKLSYDIVSPYNKVK